MKSVALWIAICGGAFLLMGAQMGLFGARPKADDADPEEVSVHKPVEAPKRLMFPMDLAPAAQANAVPQAAAYKPANLAHKLAVLTPTGMLHKWQENLHEEWAADTVESTELVVVVGTQRKIFVDRMNYPNGAPPIDRYTYECEVSVVEAKTGNVLANKLFRNLPRPVSR